MSGACPKCTRRSALLAALGMRLDFRARDLTRFWELLALDDLQLIQAIGGRRRDELSRAYQAWGPGRARSQPADVHSVCCHQRAFPRALAHEPLAPRALYVRGQVARLNALLEGTVVAIVGARRATDNGVEMARGLAHDLAACGVTVMGAFSEGIAHAVHLGALEAGGPTLSVMSSGVERGAPACCAAVYRRLTDAACVASELACGTPGRVWSQLARMRTLALASELVIVVEASESPRELACAELARRLGKSVAAVPGRVGSKLSAGTNLLIRQGATLVRGAEDILEALHGVGTQLTRPAPKAIQPHVQAVLEKVADGHDTIAKLTADGTRETEVTIALAELELDGLIVRGDGGRYVTCASGATG